MNLFNLLKKHEGLRLFPYKDTTNNWTIGIGRNLSTRGITEEEACILFTHDVEISRQELSRFRWFDKLDSIRQDALIDMVYNIGLTKFKEFNRLIAALENCKFDNAAFEMLDSLWATQVGQRAKELAFMIETGNYPDNLD